MDRSPIPDSDFPSKRVFPDRFSIPQKSGEFVLNPGHGGALFARAEDLKKSAASHLVGDQSGNETYYALSVESVIQAIKENTVQARDVLNYFNQEIKQRTLPSKLQRLELYVQKNDHTEIERKKREIKDEITSLSRQLQSLSLFIVLFSKLEAAKSLDKESNKILEDIKAGIVAIGSELQQAKVDMGSAT